MLRIEPRRRRGVLPRLCELVGTRSEPTTPVAGWTWCGCPYPRRQLSASRRRKCVLGRPARRQPGPRAAVGPWSAEIPRPYPAFARWARDRSWHRYDRFSFAMWRGIRETKRAAGTPSVTLCRTLRSAGTCTKRSTARSRTRCDDRRAPACGVLERRKPSRHAAGQAACPAHGVRTLRRRATPAPMCFPRSTGARRQGDGRRAQRCRTAGGAWF